jgi:DNA-binding transcriptional ArsR family regulator
MPLPTPLPDAVVVLVADRFRVLAEPTRIRLLDRLRAGEASVQDLAEAIDSTQQNVSKHLGILLRAGMVGKRKDGLFSYYRIVDESLFAMCELVCGSVLDQMDAVTSALSGVERSMR